tara:strand:- start:31 stop:513 length:483 start_codon:yes stop_codon:yes gene_type:complete
MNSNKSDKAFRTITEVAEILGLPAHVLRFWESKFKYIKPMKRGGGRRYYRPEDIHLLLGIKHLLYTEGLTIKGSQKIIQSRGVKLIAKMGLEKISENYQGSNELKNQNQATEKKEKLRSFSLQNQTIVHGIEAEVLKNLLENLRKIRDRIKNRCERKVVA